jgi:hypothetical protein
MSIGPTFELLAQVTGELDLDFGLVIGIDYHLENAHFVFPGGPVGGTFLGGDTRKSSSSIITIPQTSLLSALTFMWYSNKPCSSTLRFGDSKNSGFTDPDHNLYYRCIWGTRRECNGQYSRVCKCHDNC